MPKGIKSAGTQWGGLNLRSDPTDISPEQSPDCSNVFFCDQTIGLLGPRLGKTYAGGSDYNIWGILPYNIGGQIGTLVAYGDDDATDVDLIVIYVTLYPHGGWGDTGHGGPIIVPPDTINRGFAYLWDGPTQASTETHDCNVAVNGATKCIATCPSIDWETAGLLTVELKFDAGAWQTATTLGAEATSGCCGNVLEVSELANLVDCTNATALTGIRVTSGPGDGTEQFSGSVRVVGACI